MLSEREFITLILEVDGILNIRSLTYVNFDDCILYVLRILFHQTPCQLYPFLTTKVRTNSIYKDQVLRTLLLAKHLKDSRYVLEFVEENLISLGERTQKEHISKKLANRRTLRKNETLLVVESGTPRGMWKLATVKEIKGSSDGRLRSVELELPYKKINVKPVNLLYPLEVATKKKKST